ncbi:Bifunctional solanapyrone synthase [Cytospora mali]|uniref:Bifunctional solanapyrone synthase n=1 Tax=Cytospora mali TaxID=578113 RepID=A0A194VX09_CYTMA|nr:Bifunctional solanapyrone synthase [Valsa mali]
MGYTKRLGAAVAFATGLAHTYTNNFAEKISLIAENDIPFALQCGGHISNPGFSSTTGIHIALKRLNQVIISDDRSTVEIGMGLTWAEVYQQLDGTGVNVVGGRVSGPGVGGLTLGGGFSWKTNQHGLTCDTVQSYNVVLPNGTITTASKNTNTDLFFALKGGLNRFAIVTSAVYAAHTQPLKIYGGSKLYTLDKLDALLNATVAFSNTNTDPKAQLIMTIEGLPLLGVIPVVIFFYDGPNPGDSFAAFDDILPATDTVLVQSFSSFVAGQATELLSYNRGTSHTTSVSAITPALVDAVKTQLEALAAAQLLHGGALVTFDVDPFLQYGQYATDSAYPHSDSPLPISLYTAWDLSTDDAFWQNATKAAIASIKQVAVEEGIYSDSFTAYPNYAIAGTTAEELYGAVNAARLRTIKNSIDPDHVMELAGGFTIV